MKLNSLAVLCLALLLCHTHFSLAKKGGGGFGKSSGGSKKTSTSSRGSTSWNSGSRNNQGSSSQGGYPRQPDQRGHQPQPGRPGQYPNQGSHPNQGGYPNHGGYPQQPGRSGYPGGYPQQPGGGNRYQYPAPGSPYGGGNGGFPGGYINHNPNNKVLSPHYGGSFGYGGHGYGGSPFSRSVQGMGIYPSDKSRGFGRSAVMAATGGAVAGMAVGYGLGRFPRPPFHFRNPQEEHHYNHYMYKRYGTKSTDTNDYSRDYTYISVPQTYDNYMDSCMKRTDLLPEPKNRAPAKPAPPATRTATVVVSAPDTNTSSDTTENNSTAADNSSTSAPSAPRSLNPPAATPGPAALRADSSVEDDDTVNIVEIGYPALIEQMKARICVERYMAFSSDYLKRVDSGVRGLEMGSQGLLAVLTGTILMLLNSNMLMLLH